MDQNKASNLVTVPTAARRTGLGQRQFRRAIASGDLSIYDFGAWPRLKWGEVEDWIERQRRRPAAEQQR